MYEHNLERAECGRVRNEEVYTKHKKTGTFTPP